MNFRAIPLTNLKVSSFLAPTYKTKKPAPLMQINALTEQAFEGIFNLIYFPMNEKLPEGIISSMSGYIGLQAYPFNNCHLPK